MSRYRLYGLAAAILFVVTASAWLCLHNRGKERGKEDRDAKESPHALAKLDKPGPEEASQYTPSLRERERGVREKEESVKKRQEALELLKKDLRNERAALDDLRKQVQDELRQVSRKVAGPSIPTIDPEVQRASARDEAELSRRLHDSETAARNNLLKEAALYETMSPEKTAAILQKMYTDEPDKAVKLLAQMKAPVANDVLAEVSIMNPELSAKLNARMGAARGFSATAPPVAPPAPGLPVAPVPPMPPSYLPPQLR